MHVFKKNFYGGLDIFSSDDKFLVHLNSDDLKKIFDIQQKNYDVDTVLDRIPDWVAEQTEQDDYFFADFNSTLFSDDEIDTNEISSKILSNGTVIDTIAKQYREDYDGGTDWWVALNKAIESNVSVKGILGEILCEKYPKEFRIGHWRVVVVEKGDCYGENGALYHEDDKPVVEFYDMSVDKKDFPNGQFTSGRYYLNSLLSSQWSMSLEDMAKEGVALELCGGVDAWVVSSGELNVISAWLGAVQNHIELAAEKDNTLDNTLVDAQERSRKSNVLDVPTKDSMEYGE